MSNKVKRRTIKGLFVNPKAQVRYAALVSTISLIALSALIAGMSFSVNSALTYFEETSTNADLEILGSLRESLMVSLTLAFALSVGLSTLAFLTVILINRRFYGPLVPIRRHIDELVKGNYNAQLHLRKDDEFQELKESLDKLTLTLKERHGSSTNVS